MSGKVFTDFDACLMAVRWLLQGDLAANAGIKIAAKSLQRLNPAEKIVTEDFFRPLQMQRYKNIFSMSSTFKVLFYVRKNYVNKNGKAGIMIRITLNGEICQFCSKLEIAPELWDTKKGKALKLPNLMPCWITFMLPSRTITGRLNGKTRW
jgi:hypothetical protein